MKNVDDVNPATNLPGLLKTSPLHMAAHQGHFEICRLIVENVQDKCPVDGHGDTPLHMAAHMGHQDIYHLIAQNVPDKNPMDNDGVTPLDYAKQERNADMCQFIRDKLRLSLCFYIKINLIKDKPQNYQRIQKFLRNHQA